MAIKKNKINKVKIFLKNWSFFKSQLFQKLVKTFFSYKIRCSKNKAKSKSFLVCWLFMSEGSFFVSITNYCGSNKMGAKANRFSISVFNFYLFSFFCSLWSLSLAYEKWWSVFLTIVKSFANQISQFGLLSHLVKSDVFIFVQLPQVLRRFSQETWLIKKSSLKNQ